MNICPCGLRVVMYAGLCRECHEDRVRRQLRSTELKIVPHESPARRADDINITRMARQMTVEK